MCVSYPELWCVHEAAKYMHADTYFVVADYVVRWFPKCTRLVLNGPQLPIGLSRGGHWIVGLTTVCNGFHGDHVLVMRHTQAIMVNMSSEKWF